MRMSKAEIEEGIGFVFGECVRFTKMSITELRQRPKADFFCDLPHPSGRGKMNCGREAENRLRDIHTGSARAQQSLWPRFTSNDARTLGLRAGTTFFCREARTKSWTN